MPDALDEQIFAKPEVPHWYQNEGPRQGFPWATQYMHENMIHRYLSEFPLFDFNTKNGLPLDQSRNDLGAWHLTHNRRDFEQWLSQRDGIEYMLVDGATYEPPAKNGIWLIRKQERKKAAGKDDLQVLATYYLIRENLYQAPSIADVVGSRMLTATTALTDFISKTTELRRPLKASEEVQSRSRESSVALEMPTTSGVRASRVMQHLDQYGDEFADENPHVGEPGHFTFASSVAAVKKRRADDEAAKAQEAARNMPAVLKSDAAPPAVLSDAKLKAERKGSKTAEKARKRKSRANIQTPATPASATPI